MSISRRWIVKSHSPLVYVPSTMLASQTVLQPQVVTTNRTVEYMPSMQFAERTVESTNRLRFRVPLINPYDLDDIPTEYRAMLTNIYPPRRDEDIEGWFDYFQREIANYKQAIRRIIQEVNQSREQYKSLVTANEDLRAKMGDFDKKRKRLVEIFEGDKIDKTKMNDVFNRLNAKISSQTLELREYHTKLSNYEKELAKRSEFRAQYETLLKSSQVRENELQLTKDRLARADGLEETVRRQELVIEKLEAMINTYMKEKRLKGAFTDVDRSFLSEHAQVGIETQQLQRRVPKSNYATSAQDELAKQNVMYEQQLANLRARFQENAMQWGREKADLLNQINSLDQPMGKQPLPRNVRKLRPLV